MGRWDIVESSESRSEVNQVRASTGPYIVVKALRADFLVAVVDCSATL